MIYSQGMIKHSKFLFIFLFFFPLFLFSDSFLHLKEKFYCGKVGDYIVSSQEGHYSLLFIRSLSKESLILEEVTIPEYLIDLKQCDWQSWLNKKAPGHTSWTLYEVSLDTGKLIEAFSYSKKGWLYLTESEQFFSRLMTLPLTRVSQENRKKIGPSPEKGEEDRRALWNPPVTIYGKKLSKPSFEVFSTRWPEDSSPLSSCHIELYFFKDDPSFPFPFWLEIKSPHYSFKMKAVDSGHNLFSPIPGKIPYRSPSKPTSYEHTFHTERTRENS